MFHRLIFGGLCLLPSCARTVPAARETTFADLQRYLALPDDAIDVATAKLAVDRPVDSGIDTSAETRSADSRRQSRQWRWISDCWARGRHAAHRADFLLGNERFFVLV